MSGSRKSRALFTSRFGVIAAAAGSAIGLGNIWKFPYITGVYGGAAFLFVYLAFILAIGLPIMLSELIIGRKSRKNAFGAFKKLAPGTPWRFIGSFGVGAAFIILSFYGVVAGWSIRYIVFSLTNHFHNSSPEAISSTFNAFITSPGEPLVYQIIFMLMTGAIIMIGVQKGIERYSKILMPLLLTLILILDIRAVTLHGAYDGLRFLFKPDFSKLTYEGILSALGHAFFSLSLGMGTLITYGSYVRKENNLVQTAIQVTAADTIIAILAGIAIFPAVFAFNIEPGEGVGLIFITLPNVFMQMPGGYIFSIMFFVLLTIAALTSAISILEVVVAYFSEELKMKRNVATVFATILITLLGIICSLSLGIFSDVIVFNRNIFDLLDHISANILLPLGGMFIALFIGWIYGRYKVLREVAHGGKLKGQFLKIFMVLVKFIAPIAIFIVFLKGIKVLDFLVTFIKTVIF
ncbi:MAG: sodium-dependent transporter [Bacteroidales bacterium]|nr:sodium-dependent transporter [Bacteroidales bacterium]